MPPGSWGLCCKRIQRTRQSDQRSRCLWVQKPDSNWERSAAGVPCALACISLPRRAWGVWRGLSSQGPSCPWLPGPQVALRTLPPRTTRPTVQSPGPVQTCCWALSGCWGPRTHSHPVPWVPWPGWKAARTSGSPGGGSALSGAGAGSPPSTHLGAGPPSVPAAPAAGRHPPTPGWGPAPRAPPWVPPPGAAAIRPQTSSGPSQATASVAPGRRPSCFPSGWALSPRAARGPSLGPGEGGALGGGTAGRGGAGSRCDSPLCIPFRRDRSFPETTRVPAGGREGTGREEPG